MDAKQRIIKGCGGVVSEHGCWIWIESLKNGYGQLTWESKNTYAHRLSYKTFKGQIPKKSLVCHKCHNRKCVNPDHLYAGDKKTNARDMLEDGKGKNQYGQYKKSYVLTNGERVETVTNMTKFCKENGLSRGNMHCVITGKRNSSKGWRLSK